MPESWQQFEEAESRIRVFIRRGLASSGGSPDLLSAVVPPQPLLTPTGTPFLSQEYWKITDRSDRNGCGYGAVRYFD